MSQSLNTSLQGLFRGLFVFGDSVSDYGSRAAAAQRDVFLPDAVPPWSGVTYSNTRQNWQTRVAETLGVAPPATTQGQPPVSPYVLYANSLIAPFSLAEQTARARSYAIGGATSGRINFNQLSHPQEAPGLGLVNMGMAALMEQAFGEQQLQFNSDDLAVVWGGGNDVLVGYALQQPLAAVVSTMLAQLRNDLETALRFGGARQLVFSVAAPIRGQVDGVPYQAPFVSAILMAVASGQAPAWLNEWAQQINGGLIERMRLDASAVVADVQRKFPYANIINFNPEYQAQYERFGAQLGNFADYGISNGTSPAQMVPGMTTEGANAYAYFDTIHPTGSAHHMLARALELELQASGDAISAAKLTTDIRTNLVGVIGTKANDRIEASQASLDIQGRLGNDWLTGIGRNVTLQGQQGNDVLNGGLGRQRLVGGIGADFFAFSQADTLGADVDQIVDFNPLQGDRLGINAVLGLKASLAGQGWTYIGEQPFGAAPAQLRFANGLLSGDVDGDAQADLRIRLDGITSFDPAWIS